METFSVSRANKGEDKKVGGCYRYDGYHILLVAYIFDTKDNKSQISGTLLSVSSE